MTTALPAMLQKLQPTGGQVQYTPTVSGVRVYVDAISISFSGPWRRWVFILPAVLLLAWQYAGPSLLVRSYIRFVSPTKQRPSTKRAMAIITTSGVLTTYSRHGLRSFAGAADPLGMERKGKGNHKISALLINIGRDERTASKLKHVIDNWTFAAKSNSSL